MGHCFKSKTKNESQSQQFDIKSANKTVSKSKITKKKANHNLLRLPVLLRRLFQRAKLQNESQSQRAIFLRLPAKLFQEQNYKNESWLLLQSHFCNK